MIIHPPYQKEVNNTTSTAMFLTKPMGFVQKDEIFGFCYLFHLIFAIFINVQLIGVFVKKVNSDIDIFFFIFLFYIYIYMKTSLEPR